MSHYFSNLSQQEEEQAQELLLTLANEHGGMDFVESHGFLTAMVLHPQFESLNANSTYRQELLEMICGCPIDTLRQQEENFSQLTHFIEQALASLARAFYSDEVIALPCELELSEPVDSNPLRGWCLGFMDGVFADEAVWFTEEANQSDGAAEIESLLLPIAIAGGEQVELPPGHPLTTKKGIDTSIKNIPTTLTEIYFLFRQSG